MYGELAPLFLLISVRNFTSFTASLVAPSSQHSSPHIP